VMPTPGPEVNSSCLPRGRNPTLWGAPCWGPLIPGPVIPSSAPYRYHDARRCGGLTFTRVASGGSDFFSVGRVGVVGVTPDFSKRPNSWSIYASVERETRLDPEGGDGGG
jgi:hypothetical protein